MSLVVVDRSCEMDASPIIVDIQCFVNNYKEYILKEVCIVEKDSGVLLMHHIAKPPYCRLKLMNAMLRINYRIMRKCHGLSWDCGDIPYHELYNKLTRYLSNRSIVYVKGAEKKEYLKQHHVTDWIATNVIDVYDIGCESLSTISGRISSHTLRCSNHNTTYTRCAITHCLAIRGWLSTLNNYDDDAATDCPTTTSITNDDDSCFCSCFHNTSTAVSAGYDTVDGGGVGNTSV